MPMVCYLHVDMDAFFASVEQVLEPKLKGKPVIVGGINGHGVVTSASYEARRYGVRSAMPGFQAKELCPGGIFLPNRRGVYRDFSIRVFAILDQYSPDVRRVSIDEGIVNLTGTEKLFGPPVQTAQTILARIERDLGLSASGGLSASRMVAKIAATLAKPHGFIRVPAGTEETFLSPLPVEAIPGVGPKTHKALLHQGVKTIADLLDRSDLRGRYLDLDRPAREGYQHARSIGNETTFDAALREPEKMKAVLWKLVEEVGTRLREERLSARCLTLKIRYSNFTTITRSRTLATPTCFDREIFQIGRELLTSHLAAGASVRLLGISASGLMGSGWQESLFEIDKRLAWERLYDGMDRLRRKYGEHAVTAAPSHGRGHGHTTGSATF